MGFGPTPALEPRMIPRYSRPAMVALWEPETRFRIWFEIEAHACDALAELGVIPKSAAEAIWAKGRDAAFDVARIDAIERGDQARRHRLPDPPRRDRRAGRALRAPGHDVVGRARHLPRGAAHPRRRHADRRRRRAAGDAEAPRLRAQAHPDHRPLARHPRRAGHLRAEARPGLCRVRALPRAAGAARAEIATCALSGAVGTFANIDPRVEEHVARPWASRSSPCRRR